MPPHATQIWVASANVVLNVVALRTFPVLLAFHGSERAPASQKAIALLSYAALAFLAVRIGRFDAVAMLLAYGYLALASVLPYAIGRRCKRPWLFAVTVSLYLVIPAVLFPSNVLIALLGWDLAMASYSFCADAKDEAFNPRDYAFFLFVNPTLAYPARGTRSAPSAFCMHGAIRAARGLCALFASGVLGALATTASIEADGSHDLALAAIRITSLYLAHTGLAAFQIGLVRQLGYDLPERYDRLLASDSPAAFWTRWNTYVGVWARLYVFKPFVLALRRRNAGRRATRAVAVMGTFVAVGAYHDLYKAVQGAEVSGATTSWFAANGALLLAWHFAAERLRGVTRELGHTRRALVRVVIATMMSLVTAIGLQ